MNFKTTLFLVLALGLFSCNENNSGNEGEPAENIPTEVTPIAQPSATMETMQMQKWEVSDLIYEGDGIDVALEKKPYLIFRDGRASGFAGCNSFVGKYVEGENLGINFKDIASTKKSCSEGNIIENRYLELLRSATTYTLNSDQTNLTVKSSLGEIHFTMK